jgi:two-component system LytT family response regulator
MNLLLIDDERLARTELRRMLARLPSSPSILEAASAEEARQQLASNAVDAILLDVEMPGESGFNLLRSLGTACPPVIFTTAYAEFAARAFDSGAVDYLLKPFGQKRLQKALSRLAPEEAESFGAGDRILLKIDGECLLLPVEEIESIESLGRDGTTIRWGTSCGKARQTIGRLESRLDPNLFFRASRDTMVNVRAIKNLIPGANGTYSAELSNGRRIEFSRRQSSLFRRNHSV